MIKWTLTKRIWLSFAFLIVMIGVIIAFVYPFSIQEALEEDSFATIEQEQLQDVLHQNPGNLAVDKSGMSFLERQQAAKSVGNLLVVNGHIQGDPVPASVWRQMNRHVKQQRGETGRYQLQYHGAVLYYVVRQIEVNTESGYLISYMWDTYTNELMQKLWARLVFIFILAGILSLFIAFWLARYLKRPLDVLGRRFEEIARLNWEKPFEWKSGDEFERLSAQFEKMRLNLIKYDESQKIFLQQASHELKTPIMVVQSYAQSVKDHIFPKGGLDDSMDVIINEASQMEKRVRKLLYFTRVDSLREQPLNLAKIHFGDLALLMKERLSTQRPSVSIHVKGEDVPLWVDAEQCQILLENLTENAMRYARNNIWMIAESEGGETKIVVKNDGRPIPKQDMAALFEPFRKGEKGQFGLGLAIVKRVVEHHGGRINVTNDEDGVAFVITLPARKD